MKIRGSMVVLVLVPMMSACVPTDTSRNTVAYFEQNDAERREQMALCRNDPGRLWDTRDCINARHADARKGMRSLRDLPPIGLIEKDERLKSKGENPTAPEPR